LTGGRSVQPSQPRQHGLQANTARPTAIKAAVAPKSNSGGDHSGPAGNLFFNHKMKNLRIRTLIAERGEPPPSSIGAIVGGSIHDGSRYVPEGKQELRPPACKFACNNDPLRGRFFAQIPTPFDVVCAASFLWALIGREGADGAGWGGDKDRGKDNGALFEAKTASIKEIRGATAFGIFCMFFCRGAGRLGARVQSQTQD